LIKTASSDVASNICPALAHGSLDDSDGAGAGGGPSGSGGRVVDRTSRNSSVAGDLAAAAGSEGGEYGSTEDTTEDSHETPNFFASTKFFACLELEESQVCWCRRGVP